MIGSLLSALLLMAQQPPVIDTHVHLHEGDKSVQDYQGQLKAAGVNEVAFGAMWFGGGNQALAGDTAAIRRGNDSILALARNYPNMVPIGTVHPYDGPAAIAELERIAGLGIKVLKIHPHTQKFDPADPRVLALVTRAGELGMVVLMDNANIIPGDSEKLLNLALAAPKTRFIFAHIGGLNFRFWNILKLARTAENLVGDNIYFDISGTSVLAAGSPIQDEFVWTLRNVGIDYVLLGSDFPQMTLPQTLQALDKLPLTDEEKEKIRFGNARKLLGLKVPAAAR